MSNIFTRALTVAAGGAIVAGFAVPVAAQSTPPRAVQILTLACRGQGDGALVSPERLAEATIVSIGILPMDIPSGLTPRTYLASIQQQASSPIRLSAEQAVGEIEQYLRVTPGNPATDVVRYARPVPSSSNWLLDPASGIELRCVGERAPPTAPFPRVRLRGSPDGLGASGSAMLTTPAASIAATRTRTTDATGADRTATSITLDATLGIALTERTDVGSAFVYADYSLARSRIRPVAAGGPPAGTGDTNSLAIGLIGTAYPQFGDSFSAVSLDASYTRNFVDDSELLRGRMVVAPGFAQAPGSAAIGLCSIGRYARIGRTSPLWGRCSIQFEVEGAEVLRTGTGTFTSTSRYLAAGGQIGYELLLFEQGEQWVGLGTVGGPFATVTYRYLPVIAGDLDDIERFETRLGYRRIYGGRTGIELTFSYVRGTNRLSFADEDIVKIGAGILFR